MLWLLQKGRRSRCTPSHSLVRKSFLQLQCCRVHAAGAHPRRTRPERRRSSSSPSLSSLETEHNTLRLGSFFLRETCPHISALSQLRCPLAAATTKEKGSRRKSHCWAEPSPCLTSSAQKRSSALCFSRLHRIYHCHLCIAKHEASRIVSRGNAGRELGSSTSSRQLNFLFPTAKVNPQTSEWQMHASSCSLCHSPSSPVLCLASQALRDHVALSFCWRRRALCFSHREHAAGQRNPPGCCLCRNTPGLCTFSLSAR